jgi:hypothetical protein
LILTAADKAELPFTAVASDRVECRFKGRTYSLAAERGAFSKPDSGTVFRISPQANQIILKAVAESRM